MRYSLYNSIFSSREYTTYTELQIPVHLKQCRPISCAIRDNELQIPPGKLQSNNTGHFLLSLPHFKKFKCKPEMLINKLLNNYRGNYMFKIIKRNTTIRCKTCSKLTIKTVSSI